MTFTRIIFDDLCLASSLNWETRNVRQAVLYLCIWNMWAHGLLIHNTDYSMYCLLYFSLYFSVHFIVFLKGVCITLSTTQPLNINENLVNRITSALYVRLKRNERTWITDMIENNERKLSCYVTWWWLTLTEQTGSILAGFSIL